MRFKVGDRVYVQNLRRVGVILAEQAKGYSVRVGSVVVLCDAGKLRPATPKDTARRVVPRRDRPLSPHVRKVLERVDLHGMRVEEALRTVEQALNQALMAGVEQVEIVHGIGKGKIKEALHKYLSSLEVVARYRVDAGNPGVTWVYF